MKYHTNITKEREREKKGVVNTLQRRSMLLSRAAVSIQTF